MTGPKDGNDRKLIDRLAAKSQYGPRLGLVGTTYEFDPEFFEIDFLPTLLELGAWDDRSLSSRIAVEKALAELDAAAVLTDARCYRGRPHSLRVELLPVDFAAGAKLHAKVLLIVHEQAVRLIVGSANLTESGYRMNREIAAVIEATPKDSTTASLILAAIEGFGSFMKRERNHSIQIVLASARQQIASWTAALPTDVDEWFQWSDSDVRLWRAFLKQWPEGEAVERITIVSPFWSAEEKGGPIELFLKAVLDVSGPILKSLDLRLLTEAKPGSDGTFFPSFGAGLPHIPTDLLKIDATAHAVDPSVSKEEIDVEGFSASRSLHAKVVLLEGHTTALAYMGSANFSRRGWGFGGGPANVEAGLIVRRTGRHRQVLRDLIPAVVGEAVQLTGNWEKRVFVDASVVDVPLWPSFILSVRLVPAADSTERLDLEIAVDTQKVAGEWSAHFVEEHLDEEPPLVPSGRHNEPFIRIRLESPSLERLLRDKEIRVRWWLCSDGRAIPLNVAYEARDALPISPAGGHPGEALLIEYYQGRISFEELFPAPAVEIDADETAANSSETSSVDTSRIQSYQIREFVEALPGILADLSAATMSTATIRLALLGPVSPVALAREISLAVKERRRTSVAAGFQFVEILGCLYQARKLNVPEKHAENWATYCTKAIAEVESILLRLKNEFPEELSSKSSFSRYESMLRKVWGGLEHVA